MYRLYASLIARLTTTRQIASNSASCPHHNGHSNSPLRPRSAYTVRTSFPHLSPFIDGRGRMYDSILRYSSNFSTPNLSFIAFSAVLRQAVRQAVSGNNWPPQVPATISESPQHQIEWLWAVIHAKRSVLTTCRDNWGALTRIRHEREQFEDRKAIKTRSRGAIRESTAHICNLENVWVL